MIATARRRVRCPLCGRSVALRTNDPDAWTYSHRYRDGDDYSKHIVRISDRLERAR